MLVGIAETEFASGGSKTQSFLWPLSPYISFIPDNPLKSKLTVGRQPLPRSFSPAFVLFLFFPPAELPPSFLPRLLSVFYAPRVALLSLLTAIVRWTAATEKSSMLLRQCYFAVHVAANRTRLRFLMRSAQFQTKTFTILFSFLFLTTWWNDLMIGRHIAGIFRHWNFHLGILGDLEKNVSRPIFRCMKLYILFNNGIIYLR